MPRHTPGHIEVPFLRRRLPGWPEEIIRDAEERYLRFLELQIRIFEEAEAAEQGYPPSDLTDGGISGIN